MWGNVEVKYKLVQSAIWQPVWVTEDHLAPVWTGPLFKHQSVSQPWNPIMKIVDSLIFYEMRRFCSFDTCCFSSGWSFSSTAASSSCYLPDICLTFNCSHSHGLFSDTMISLICGFFLFFCLFILKPAATLEKMVSALFFITFFVCLHALYQEIEF